MIYLLLVGGTSDTDRSTVFSVDSTGKCVSNSLKSGDCTLSGALTASGNLNGSRGIFSADVVADSVSTKKVTSKDALYGSVFQPKTVAITNYKTDGKLINDQAAIINNKIYVRNYEANEDKVKTQTQITSNSISISGGSNTTTINNDKISTTKGEFSSNVSANSANIPIIETSNISCTNTIITDKITSKSASIKYIQSCTSISGSGLNISTNDIDSNFRKTEKPNYTGLLFTNLDNTIRIGKKLDTPYKPGNSNNSSTSDISNNANAITGGFIEFDVIGNQLILSAYVVRYGTQNFTNSTAVNSYERAYLIGQIIFTETTSCQESLDAGDWQFCPNNSTITVKTRSASTQVLNKETTIS